MSIPVKLYVYDLSNGMARQMSMQMTGKQIDGIWHTSVVVFGKEFFYGQGISVTAPGKSHHGSPHQIIDVGETFIDESTFSEYLEEIRVHYTADKYHLLDFNCNSFTNDCVGFLTGGSIPAFIKDLPTDFLSTPFGAALRPTIDAMYRRPGTARAASASQIPQPGASMLQSVAAQARPTSSTRPIQATQSLTTSMHIITNSPSFQSFLKSHRAAVAFFTSATCGPCKMIEPIYERLSEERGVQDGKPGAGFAKIDIDVGLARTLAAEWSVRATPTFMFFMDGKKINEIKGADANELRTQVNLLLYQTYPPHPHTSISLPAIQALSLNPILFTQVPAIDTVVNKLFSIIDDTPWPPSLPQSQSQVKSAISNTVVPYLKARFTPPANIKTLPSATPAILTTLAQATATLVKAIPVDSLFPLIDIWRLIYLDPAVVAWSSSGTSADPIATFLLKASISLQTPSKSSRNYILTVLRMLSNLFSSSIQASRMLEAKLRDDTTAILVPSLLHEDGTVRTAAASLAFNMSSVVQKRRVDAVRNGAVIVEQESDWEVEMVTAVLEAIDREKDNEEVAHRLTASLACLLRLSPIYDTQLKSLLEVLQSKHTLKAKLVKGDGWNREGGVSKKEIRKLIEEVVDKLCP